MSRQKSPDNVNSPHKPATPIPAVMTKIKIETAVMPSQQFDFLTLGNEANNIERSNRLEIPTSNSKVCISKLVHPVLGIFIISSSSCDMLFRTGNFHPIWNT
jgi:hypothetical protein